MELKFNIEYHTTFGEQMVLNMKVGGEKVVSYRMDTHDGLHWTSTVKGKFSVGQVLDYYYSVERNGQPARHEWQVVAHRLQLDGKKGVNYTVYDHWVDIPEDSYRYSSAFTDCVAKHASTEDAVNTFGTAVCLKVRAPQLRQGQRLVLVGEDKALGNWHVEKGLPMVEHNFNEWKVNIDTSKLSSDTLVFKFVVIGEGKDVSPIWEVQDNRTISLTTLAVGDVVVYELPQAFFPISNQRLAGSMVPVFSLRSKTSFGVGDFGDLKKMVDWVALTGQRLLQILPINDSTSTHTWTDSYPYSCISIYALHPQYADLTALPQLKDKKKAAEFEQLRLELNALPQIDYERVNNAKTEYLGLLFEQEGDKTLRSVKYKEFFEEEKQWLVSYAEYCVQREKKRPASALQHPAVLDVKFYYYVQFVLAVQMKEAHAYARSKGVILKGDIPIGVNRTGSDVFMEPRYFNLNGQAGAPPDDFSVNGQNWGFPTYNWDEMLRDDCAWWVRRFQNMAKYFDAYRIDHVLGFFRIWEIPVDAVHGLLGQFSPSLGMTREEIEAYGLHFQDELFLEPFIMDWVIDRVFHEDADYVRTNFLEPIHDGRYRMKEAFNTQRKVEAWYEEVKDNEGKEQHALSLASIRDGLYALISDVLFLRDRKDPNKFHPRISVQFDFIYESLYDSDKFIFNKLYNDYYYRRNNQFWYSEAMKKLPKLTEATRMLVCAEDLGMVPDCVAWVMNELRILSLELQSMPKDPKVKFGHLSQNPYRSVSTISTHDMPTLRIWWDEDWQRTQEYYNTMLYRGDAAPHPLPGWLASDIVSRHLTSPSMLCIVALQDWLAIDEKLRLPPPIPSTTGAIACTSISKTS